MVSWPDFLHRSVDSLILEKGLVLGLVVPLLSLFVGFWLGLELLFYRPCHFALALSRNIELEGFFLFCLSILVAHEAITRAHCGEVHAPCSTRCMPLHRAALLSLL